MTNNPRDGGARKESERNGPAYARALLAELPKVTDVREIASSLGLDLREADADSFEGALVRAKDLPLGAVVVRKSIREAGRKNFTIAHEIGHFVLPGHDRTSLACAASDVANWADSAKNLEREADEFAAELLMPASLVQEIGKNAPPSLQLIEEIARKSRSSFSAAAWRYCDLATEPCAVVWSTDGAIFWSKRSAHFPFSLPKSKRIEKSSFAAACFKQTKVPKRPHEVPTHFWISSSEIGKETMLLEQSKALPTYRSVISLLWMKEAR
jgi:hypothetical protein